MIEIKAFASGSTGNCYLVTDGSSPLLLDPGIRYQRLQRELGHQVSVLSGALVSHEHHDHCRAVPDLLRVGMEVYMSRGTQDALRLASHRVHTVQARQQLRIGSWTILPFETQHDAEEPLGFLMVSDCGGKLLYATDTYYIRYRFRGLTHVMLEINYSRELLEASDAPVVQKRRVMKSHFSLKHALDFLRASDLDSVEEIWLLHLSDEHSDAAMFRRRVMEVTGKPVYVAGEDSAFRSTVGEEEKTEWVQGKQPG